MLDLVGNSENRSSHGAAQMSILLLAPVAALLSLCLKHGPNPEDRFSIDQYLLSRSCFKEVCCQQLADFNFLFIFC